MRLDCYLAEKGLTRSRSSAKEAIAAGRITVNGRIITKASHDVSQDDQVKADPRERYVSRGGYKLERALDVFGLEVGGKRALDIGASTGGFTDCLLQHGAAFVCAVDVGSLQLAEALRQHPLVQSLENCNIRTFDPTLLSQPPDIIVSDLSFISLKLVLDKIVQLLPAHGQAVLLIKPQFEAGQRYLSKHGVVRDRAVHARVIQEIANAAAQYGLYLNALTPSPFPGGDGNREYLALFTRTNPLIIDPEVIRKEVFDL